MGTGKEQSIRIESATSLSEDEIQQKISEAEQFAAEDEERQKKVELRNTADNIVYQTRRTLKEAGDKLEGEDTSEVEEKLTELEALIRTDDQPVSDDDLDEDAIQAKVQELEEAMHGISAKLYEAAAANVAEDGDGDHTDIDGDDVVDADFEVVEDDNDE
jgi:molecular chaperone DnaK